MTHQKILEGPTPQILDSGAILRFLDVFSASRNFCEIWNFSKIKNFLKFFFQNFCSFSRIQRFVWWSQILFKTQIECLLDKMLTWLITYQLYTNILIIIWIEYVYDNYNYLQFITNKLEIFLQRHISVRIGKFITGVCDKIARLCKMFKIKQKFSIHNNFTFMFRRWSYSN